jgi:type III pantothenate kinase
MKLVIDIGNTLTKIAIYEGRQMMAFTRMENFDVENLKKFIAEYPLPTACIVSSVSTNPIEVVSVLGDEFPSILFDHTTALPFINCYSTPETLGKDRLAGVAAAFDLFRGQDVLVIDAGTAITYDLLTSRGEYLGGAISPGIRMRYKALNTFTEQLPLLEMKESAMLVGNTTENSIHSGVLNGVANELEGVTRKYLQQYPAIQIILTGGDYNYFDKQLKVKTFAAPNLVLEGLNFILSYNLEKKKPN